MTNQQTPRQQALTAIWNSEGPDDLVEILADQAAARSESVIDELKNEAQACEHVNPLLAIRLTQMSEAIEQIHEAVSSFSTVTDLSILAIQLRSSPIAWHPTFPRLIEEFAKDYIAKGNRETAQAIRVAAEVHQTAKSGIKLIEQLSVCPKEKIWEFLEKNQILCEPAFHEIVELAVKMAQKAGYTGISDMQGMREYLVSICRIMQRYREQKDIPPDKEGRIPVRLPIPPELASIWFQLIPGLSEACRRLAPEVAAGSRSFADAAALAESKIPEGARCSPAQAKTSAMAALCEHVLYQSGPRRTEEALRQYRAIIDSPEFKALDDEEQRTWVLRYGMALQRTWRECEDPLSLIQESVEQLGAAIARTDPIVSPRLLRDLYFTRARHLENLGKLSPECYEQAEEDYEAGLKVIGIAHEVEARAMALMDLANTMRSRYALEMAKHDSRVRALYEEAVNSLSSEKYPLNKAAALNNYATYFNERVIGDPSQNEERALSLATEAVQTLEGMIKSHPPTLFERTNLASAYNTKANILRDRKFGNKEEQLKEAKKAYESGIALIDLGMHDDLLATMWLNLGHVEIDLGYNAGDGTCLARAMAAYSKAESAAENYPLQHARAVIAIAGLVLEGSEQTDRAAIDQSVEALNSTLNTLIALEVPDDLARANLILGSLYRARSKGEAGEDLDRAVARLKEARALYVRLGESEYAISTMLQIADCHIRAFRDMGDRELLNSAKAELFEAADLVEKVWQQHDSIQWRHEVSASFAEVYGRLAWCEAMLGASVYEVLFHATRAKGREISAHVSGLLRNKKGMGKELVGYLDTLRIHERLAEVGRWAVQRSAETQASIITEIVEADRLGRHARTQRELFLGADSAKGITVEDLTKQVEGFLNLHPNAVICDLTVCKWGTTIVLLSGPNVMPHCQSSVSVMPLTRDALDGLVWGAEGQRGWNELYQDYLSSPQSNLIEKRQAWTEATDALLATVARDALGPLLQVLKSDGSECTLCIVPGMLAGFPLHAVQLSDSRRLCDIVKGVAYVPSLLMLSADKRDWIWPNSALCILSDPESDPRKQLRTAPSETVETATRLDLLGTRVTIVAAVGPDVGFDVFSNRGLTVPPTVTVLQDRPTPEWLTGHMNEYDHIFYAGHGLAQSNAGPGGLILSDAEGVEKIWTSADVLVTSELHAAPLVYLSACETARDVLANTGTDLFSFASCLLRIGSGFVVGAIWTVRDDSAHVFTKGFYDGLTSTHDPAEAFCLAIQHLKSYLATPPQSPSSSHDHTARTVDWAGFMPFMSV